MRHLVIGLMLFGFANFSYAEDLKAKEIIKKAEEIRFMEKSQADVDLKTVGGGKTIQYDIKVLTAPEQKAYLDFLAPKEERGRKMLARGKQFWSTFPDSKKVVQISKKEMIGNSAFAMADVFQIDAERDYDSKIVGDETTDGKKLIKLNLMSKHAEAPYYRIEYWVESDGYFPVKAKMYAKSDKLVKSMSVESRKKFHDRIRPETTKMVDEVVKDSVSWWTNKRLFPENVPDSVFTKEYLMRRL